MSNDFTIACPIPLSDYPTVQLAHGGGGRLMRNLIEGLFLPAFAATEVHGPQPPVSQSLIPNPQSLTPHPSPPHDSAVLPTDAARLAFTTDSYVVNPLFFPGGDIGTLAVCGTVNDLAMTFRADLCQLAKHQGNHQLLVTVRITSLSVRRCVMVCDVLRIPSAGLCIAVYSASLHRAFHCLIDQPAHGLGGVILGGH